MENGIEHGYTRTYYKNGKIEEEKMYKDGEVISTKKFPKFDNPRVELKINSRICKECYEDEETLKLPDNEPKLLNKEELEKVFKADKSLFAPYGDDHILGYSYIVQIADQIENSLRKFKYEIAYKNNEATGCIFFVQHQLNLTE